MQQLADASLTRTQELGHLRRADPHLASSGNARRTLTFRSPVSGIVTEKKAVQGMRFMPGETLYQVTDLSTVWVIADVFEQDIGLVKSGARARVKINAYPDKTFDGAITYVYPTLNGRNPHHSGAHRTGQSRNLLLKPGMFAQVELAAATRARCRPCRFRPSSTAVPARSSWCRQGRTFRAARSEARGPQREPRRSARRRPRRRGSGGRRQLPDRRREQPQGGGRRLRSGGATGSQPSASAATPPPRPGQRGTATGPKARWRRSTPAAVSRASAMARWPASNGRR
jgi:hypothetical protein